MRGVGSWFVEAPGVGGVRNGLIELLLPDPLSEEISGHLLVRDMLHVNLAGADPLLNPFPTLLSPVIRSGDRIEKRD